MLGTRPVPLPSEAVAQSRLGGSTCSESRNELPAKRECRRRPSGRRECDFEPAELQQVVGCRDQPLQIVPLKAADGTRTHDLLHGKQWLNRGFSFLCGILADAIPVDYRRLPWVWVPSG
jgi:hypothetical protein